MSAEDLEFDDTTHLGELLLKQSRLQIALDYCSLDGITSIQAQEAIDKIKNLIEEKK